MSGAAAAAPRPAARRDRVAGGRFVAGLAAVLERDFLVLTSSMRYVILRTAVVVIVAALAFVILGTTGIWGNRDATDEQSGQALFAGAAVAYPILVFLVGPALGAGAIAGERSLDTLPLVLASPVRPLAFVLAKFLSRLLALMVPLVGGLPIAALCFLYGGISPSLFVAWLGVVLAFAVMACAASILASAYGLTVAGALTLSYFLGLVVPWLESMGAFWLYHEGLDRAGPRWLLDHTAAQAAVSVITPIFGRGTLGGDLAPFFGTVAVVSSVALAVAAARLSREAHAVASSGPRDGSVRRVLFANPVLDRATLGLPFRRGGKGAWATWIVVAALTWLPVSVSRWDDDEILSGLNIGTWAVVFVLLARASQIICTERQQGSLGVLRTSRLGPRAIVVGKLQGLVVQGAVFLLPGAVLAALGAVTGEIHPLNLVTWLLASGVVLLLFSAIGMKVSATAATGGRAAGTAFGVGLGSMVAHGFLLLVFVLVARGSADEDVMIPLVSASPPVSLGWLTFAPSNSGWSGDERQFLAWSIFWSFVHVGIAAALLARAVRAVGSEGDDPA